MQITLNGESYTIEDSATVRRLLDNLKLQGPLAVEINREICPKALHEQTALKEGDVLEIVTIVGGG